jgi:hypothetical protein
MAHQADDVDRLRYHPRVNVWNDLGTGKTYTVAWLLQDWWVRGVIDEAVIVGPSMLYRDWAAAFDGEAWPEGLAEVMDARPPRHRDLMNTLRSRVAAPQGRFVAHFTTFSGVRAMAIRGIGRSARVDHDDELWRRLRGRKVGLVIDEAQGAALPTSDQARACRAVANCCAAVVDMTATPVGRWEHLRVWGLTKLVRPDVVSARRGVSLGGCKEPLAGSFDAFKSRYAFLRDPGEEKTGRFSLSRAYPVDVRVDLVTEEILAPMVPYTVRRSKAECLDLPPKVRLVRAFPRDSILERLLRDLVEDDRAVLADGHAVTPANVLEERLRCVELTGGWLEGRPVHSHKLSLLKQVLVVDVADGSPGPVAVWASRSREIVAAALVAAGVSPDDAQSEATAVFPHDSSISQSAYSAAVQRAENGGVGVLHGPTSVKDRDRIQSAWRSGDLTTVVAHPGVAGAGLNWQFVVNTIYYSQPLGMIARQQSEDRVHRKGLNHTAVYFDLVMEDGPDLAVALAHAGQRDAQSALLQWLTEATERFNHGG